MSADAFEDPAVFMRDLPAAPRHFAHRVAVIVDASSSEVAVMLLNLPEGTIVWGAYVDRSTLGHGDQLDLHVCLVHPALPVVPKDTTAPRVTVREFHEMVTR